MTANTSSFDFGTRNGSFSFNVQEKAHRQELGEVFSSVSFTPANGSGEFLVLGPQVDFVERRGALNAMLEYFYELTSVGSAFHWYSIKNPNRVGGELGWVDLSKLDLPNDFSSEIQRRFVIEGSTYFVTLPHKAFYTSDGKTLFDEPGAGRVKTTRVFINNSWAKVSGLGGNRLTFTAGRTDEKSGRDLGEVKHHYLALLAAGTKITVAVTLGAEWTDKATGKTWRPDGLQKKAIWQARVQSVEGFDWEAAREKLIEDRILYSTVKAEESSNQAAFPELYTTEAKAEAVEELGKKAEGTAIGVFIMVDGEKKDIAFVPAGVYKLLSNGKMVRPSVPVARITGHQLLKGWSQKGYSLETIKVYAKAE